NKSRAVTLENLIKKYGNEEGQERWNAYCERQRHTCSLEYFIETYGNEEGTKKYESALRAFIEAGMQSHTFICSNISIEMFDKLKNYFNENEIFYGDKNEQKIVINRSIYSLDYYDKTLNICVEFNGDYWHCNPNKYKENDYWKSPYDKNLIPVKQIWDRDKKRLNNIESTGLKVFVIWESDYKKNKHKCVEDLVNRINEYVNSTKIKKQKTNSLV
ncbi:MAG: hypothetical protein RSE41_04075, partial [Clostridia bacterium]